MDRRAASPYARDESLRRIFAVLGIPPEELAYTMAAYSRSKRSFLETNAFITGQKAADFLETFYFPYGHRSNWHIRDRNRSHHPWRQDHDHFPEQAAG